MQDCFTCKWAYCKKWYYVDTNSAIWKWIESSRDIILYLCNPRQGPKCGTCSQAEVFIEVYPCLFEECCPAVRPWHPELKLTGQTLFSKSPCLAGYCPKLWPLKYSFLPCFYILHNKPHGSYDSEKFHLLRSDFLPQNIFPMYKFVIEKKCDDKDQHSDHPQRYCVLFYGLERSGICYIPYFFLNSILFHPTVGKILYTGTKKSTQRARSEVLASQSTKPSWHRSLAQ